LLETNKYSFSKSCISLLKMTLNIKTDYEYWCVIVFKLIAVKVD